MTFLKELRDAAMACTNVDYRETLRFAADNLDVWQGCFAKHPTRDNMRALNGAWSHAERVLEHMPVEAEPVPPTAGAGEVEKRRMAA